MGNHKKNREGRRKPLLKHQPISKCLRLGFRTINQTISYQDVPIWGLSCQHRQDRRERMDRDWRKQGLAIDWFLVEKHPTDGKQGCWESHAHMWRDAHSKGIEWLCVVEDDAEWVGTANIAHIPPIPLDAKMAYLGGQIHWTWEDPIQEASHWDNGRLKNMPPEWIRAVVWTTHAYLICLRDDVMPPSLKQFMTGERPYTTGYEVDKFFVEEIHPKEQCYALRNIQIIQHGDYSDIEGCEVDYSPMVHTAWGIPKPNMERGEEGELRVPLPSFTENELPTVSIITPTWARSHLWGWTLRNVLTQWYPLQKIEWIVLEEDWSAHPTSPYRRATIPAEDIPSPEEAGGLVVRYTKVEPTEDGKPQTIAWKRNKGCELAKHQVIAFFDDDDYYPPTSLLSRVKTLLTYRQKSIVGSSLIAAYDVHEETSGFMTDGRLAFGEASMAFWRRAWLQQKFDPTEVRGEYRSFLSGRWNECMDIPCVFVMYALKWKHHGTVVVRDGNGDGGEERSRRPMTGAKWRSADTGEEDVDFRKWWDEETLHYLGEFRKIDWTEWNEKTATK